MNSTLTWKNIRKCFFGQILAILIAIGTISQSEILENDKDIKYFVLYFGIYIIIFIVSLISIISKIIFKTKEKKKKYDFDMKKFLILIRNCGASCILDYLGGHFLQMSFSNTSTYLIILISQLLYPMSVAIEYFYQKRRESNYKKIFAFLVISFACFIINFVCEKKEFHWTIKDLGTCMLSNFLYITDTFLQANLVENTPPILYSACFSGVGIFIGPIISLILQENPSIKDISTALKAHNPKIITYWGSIAFYYLFSSPYINIYDVCAYNGSIIMSSAYYGIYEILVTKIKNSIVFLGLFFICIIANMIIVAKNDKKFK